MKTRTLERIYTRLLTEGEDDTCPSCGATGLKPGKKFCTRCGQPRTVRCPNKHVTWPEANFCGKCGTELPPPPAEKEQAKEKTPGENALGDDKNKPKIEPSPQDQKDITAGVEAKVAEKLHAKLGMSPEDVAKLMNEPTNRAEKKKEKEILLQQELASVQKIYDKWTSTSIIADISDLSSRQEKEFLDAMTTAIKNPKAPNVIASQARDGSTGKILPPQSGWMVFLLGGKPRFLAIPKDIWNERYGS